MQFQTITVNNIKIAEIISDDILIQNAQDGLDLMGNLYYQAYDKILIYEKNITPEFFDLKNGIAGELLQKFSNYQIRLAIVGDFSKFTKKSINDFIYESNKMKRINFVQSKAEAIAALSN